MNQFRNMIRSKKAMSLILKACIFCFITGSFFSCGKKTPLPAKGTGEDFTNGAFIVCEGNFTYGNAAVSFFHRDTRQAETNIFKNINAYPLGDVFQSMYGDESRYYLVVNNSQKIEVVNASSFTAAGVIKGFNSPRYYMPFSTKAFVTDIGANGVWVVDPSALKIKSKIPVSGWTEQMVLYNNQLFVLKVKNGYQVLVIDPQQEKVTDSIAVGEEPQWMVMDKNNILWVLTNAFRKTRPANLQRIDPSTHKITLSLSFPSLNDAPTRLKLNPTLDSLLYLDNGIYRMGINETSLPAQPIVKPGAHKFYGLGVDNRTGIIYASDALDFTQPGIIFRYKAGGASMDSFRVDPGPGDFYFVN